MGSMRGSDVALVGINETRWLQEAKACRDANYAYAYLSGMARVLCMVLVCLGLSCKRGDETCDSGPAELNASAGKNTAKETHDPRTAASRLRRQIGDLDVRINENPNDAQAYYQRGRAKRLLSQYVGPEEKGLLDAAALGDFEAAHRRAGEYGFPRALVEAGRLCMSLHQFEDAGDFFTYAEPFDPGDVDVRAELARIDAHATGNWATAVQALEKLAKEPSGKGSPGVLFALGAACVKVGRLTQAEKTYRGVLELEPLDMRPKGNIALILGQRGKITEARKIFHELLEVNPSNFYAANNLASMLVKTDRPEDWKEAARLMEDVTDKIPTFPAAWGNLAGL
ncbi:MAG: tetratricopeptide repeat protein [Phycisphaerales bacterium]|nr:MAG: tetratricopeptide repeat protein [Phycisphaerales bacterium]